MNTVVATVLVAFAAILGLGSLVYLGLVSESVDFVRIHGKTILAVLQVVGIFFCGMTGKFKLGAVLCVTVLLTVLWGW